MKLAFYVLLLANIVLYLWETGSGKSRSEADYVELRLPDNVEPIRLLKELPTIPSSPVSIAEEEKDDIVPARQTQPESVSSMVEEPPPGVSIVHIPKDQPASEAGCFRFGPFSSQESALAIVREQGNDLKGAEVISGAEERSEGYWVIYPKAENVYAARANRKMLQDKGIQDTWMFDKGDMQWAISLGVFKTKERAEVMQQQLRAKDIEVEIKPRLAHSESYWVKFVWNGAGDDMQQKLPSPGGLSVKPCQ